MPGWEDMLDEEAQRLGQAPMQKLKAQPQGAQPQGALMAQGQQQPQPFVEGQAIGRIEDVNSKLRQQPLRQQAQKRQTLYGGTYDAKAKRPTDFMGFAQYAGMTGDEMDRLERESMSRANAAEVQANNTLNSMGQEMERTGGALSSTSSYGEWLKQSQQAKTALDRAQQTAAGGSWRSRALREVGGYQAPSTDTELAGRLQGNARDMEEFSRGAHDYRQRTASKAQQEAEAGLAERNAAAAMREAEDDVRVAERVMRTAPPRTDGSGFTSIIPPEEYADIGYQGGFEDTPEARAYLNAMRRLAQLRGGRAVATAPRPRQRNSDL